MIITILRALVHVLRADVKPEYNLITPGFTLTFRLSKPQNLRSFGVLPGSEFAN